MRANVLHGNMSQNARERSLEQFGSGRVGTLIATDIAARGLDVDEITHVINFDPPRTADDYVHRVGRTGRAGRTGTGVTLVLPEQRLDVSKLAGALGHGRAFAASGIVAPAAEAEGDAAAPAAPPQPLGLTRHPAGYGSPGERAPSTRTASTRTRTRGASSVALALIAGFMAVEVVVGILAHSLALLSDAAHMLTDAGALVMSLVVIRLVRRPSGGNLTFGLKRSEILSAQANGGTLLVLAGLVVYERDPPARLAARSGRAGDPPRRDRRDRRQPARDPAARAREPRVDEHRGQLPAPAHRPDRVRRDRHRRRRHPR